MTIILLVSAPILLIGFSALNAKRIMAFSKRLSDP